MHKEKAPILCPYNRGSGFQYDHIFINDHVERTMIKLKEGEDMTSFIKLFRKNEDGSIFGFPYDPTQNYYAYIQSVVQKGYIQCILTTDLMLQVAERFLLDQNGNIHAVKMLSENDELEKEISQLLEKLNSNKAYWSALKERLNVLSNNAVDMESLEIYVDSEVPYKITFRANGMLAFSDPENERVINQTMEMMKTLLA